MVLTVVMVVLLVVLVVMVVVLGMPVLVALARTQMVTVRFMAMTKMMAKVLALYLG